MGEELLEAEAIEEPAGPETGESAESVRPLPERRTPSDLSIWRGEVRTAAIAAAGGIVVGAATVAAVRASRAVAQPKRKTSRKAKDRLPGVVASRSFLIDVHLLDKAEEGLVAVVNGGGLQIAQDAPDEILIL